MTDSFDDWQDACDYADFLNWHPNNRGPSARSRADRFEVRGDGRSYEPPLPSPWHRREALFSRTG